MKTRQAFVANSSSSSFLIAVRDIKQDESYQTLPEWIKKHIETLHKRLYSSEKMTTKTDVADYLMECECVDSLEELFEDNPKGKKEYDNLIKLIDSGYFIANLSVEYGDEDGYSFVNDLPNKDEGAGIFIIKDLN